MLQFYKPNFNKTVWISSDFHAYHKNLCTGSSSWSDKSGCRNFSNQYIMTDYIVDNINRLIQQQDILLFLGDWSFGGRENIFKFRERINCSNIHLILGNHDEHIQLDETAQKLFTTVSHYNEFYFGKQLITTFHFPIGSWHKVGRNSINFYGHSHSTYSRNIGKQLDVGLDCFDLKPILFDDAVKLVNKNETVYVDHHKGDE